MSDLPIPDADARAHSERVVSRIGDEIAAAGGWIPFDRYMMLALYAPGLGYYAAGATKLGAAGDFVTAPEMTPLFARALSAQVAAILAASGRREIVEIGGGSGRLAADLLKALAGHDALPSRYAILEPSPDLRERQRATLARDAPTHGARVVWLDELPAVLDGALIANEVLDALPVHIVARRAGRWYERGVARNAAGGFEWADRPADPRIRAIAEKRFPADDDHLSEINLAAEAMVEDIGRRLVRGAALIIDYGFPATEYYHSQRSRGTLMCHYRHRAHADPFFWPGLNDITAHVDFTAMAQAAGRAGTHVAGFAGQAPFLLGCGILDALAATGEPGSKAYIEAAVSVQRLLSPAEMGELFKVIAFARSDDVEWPGFALADSSYRL